jgi:hypothetical protein
VSRPPLVAVPRRKLTPEDRRRSRGTLWVCPHCGRAYPLAEVEDRLVPVQLVMMKGLHPIANLYGPDGRPAPMELSRVIKTTTFREVPVAVPHIALCIPAMKARGIQPDLYAGLEPATVNPTEGRSEDGT